MHVCVCTSVNADRPSVSVSVCMYIRVWGCSLVSWSINSSTHTWLHSSTFRHSDESHAPFLHFCSHSVLLGRTDSYLSVSHTHTHDNQNFCLSLCFSKRDTSLCSKHLKCGAHLVLTVNFGKLMKSSATSLCQLCRKQACVWHQQNCPSAFSSNGCHSIGDHRRWARRWRVEKKRGGVEEQSGM